MTEEKIHNSRRQRILQWDIPIGSVSLEQKALFVKHLAVMMKSGLTISEILHVEEETTSGRLRGALRKVRKSVEAGHSLSDAFKLFPKIFPQLLVSAVYTGESSGTLSDNLEHVALQLQKEKELVSKIRGAMLYPVIVLAAAVILGLGLALVVLPKITTIFSGLDITLPFTTRMLIAFSNFMESYGLEFVVASVAFVFFIIWVLRSRMMQPITHWVLLRMPVVQRISKGANAARFCRTLGTLIGSGVTIEESLDIIGKTMSNYHYRRSIGSVNKRVIGGARLSVSLEDFPGLYPRIIVSMIRVGEESGRLDEVCSYLGEFFEEEVDAATKSLSAVIEPVLLIIIGLVVGFLALSVITPIYEITGSIGR